VIRAGKTLSGISISISLGFNSCSEWISATVGPGKWTFKSIFRLPNAAADRRQSNSEPGAPCGVSGLASPFSLSHPDSESGPNPGVAGGTTIGAARYMGRQSKEHTYDGAA